MLSWQKNYIPKYGINRTEIILPEKERSHTWEIISVFSSRNSGSTWVGGYPHVQKNCQNKRFSNKKWAITLTNQIRHWIWTFEFWSLTMNRLPSSVIPSKSERSNSFWQFKELHAQLSARRSALIVACWFVNLCPIVVFLLNNLGLWAGTDNVWGDLALGLDRVADSFKVFILLLGLGCSTMSLLTLFVFLSFIWSS